MGPGWSSPQYVLVSVPVQPESAHHQVIGHLDPIGKHGADLYDNSCPMGRNQNAGKTHYPRGHPYGGDNVYVDPAGNRRCRECKHLARESHRWNEARPLKRYEPVYGPRRPNQHVLKTLCPRGHPYEPPNVYIDPKGNRRCRECKRLSRLPRLKLIAPQAKDDSSKFSEKNSPAKTLTSYA